MECEIKLYNNIMIHKNLDKKDLNGINFDGVFYKILYKYMKATMLKLISVLKNQL